MWKHDNAVQHHKMTKNNLSKAQVKPSGIGCVKNFTTLNLENQNLMRQFREVIKLFTRFEKVLSKRCGFTVERYMLKDRLESGIKAQAYITI